MRKTKRLSIILLAGMLFLLSIASGCGAKEKNEPEKKDTTQSTTEPPAKLKMFFSSSGVVIPEDLDPNTEPFLEIFEKQANVDLEIIRPAYQDYVTKVNLAIASGDLPDIIHCTGTIVNEVRKAGSDGAFVELEEYIKNSKSISNLYTKDMLDLMRYSNDKKIYTLMGLDAKNSASIVARVDLIKELNGSKMPGTPDDWYQLAKKEKEKYPDSIPFTGRGGLLYLNTFFRAYGAVVDGNGVAWQRDNEKYISAFEAPKMKEAVEFHRKLYSEKLLDPTFFTNKIADEENRLHEKGTLFAIQNGTNIFNMMEKSIAKGNKNVIWAFVPHPVAPGVKPEDASYPPAPIGSHGLAINSKCKNINAAFRVLEAFLSDEVKNMAAWGREGIEYTVKDGKKVLNIDAAVKTSWRNIYGFMNTFWYPEAVQAKAEQFRPNITGNVDAFFEEYNKGIQIRDKEVYSKEPDYAAAMMVISPDIKSAEKEALAQSISIVVKAIVGEISMDEYDKQVKDYLNKYKKVTDEYNRAYTEYKNTKK